MEEADNMGRQKPIRISSEEQIKQDTSLRRFRVKLGSVLKELCVGGRKQVSAQMQHGERYPEQDQGRERERDVRQLSEPTREHAPGRIEHRNKTAIINTLIDNKHTKARVIANAKARQRLDSAISVLEGHRVHGDLYGYTKEDVEAGRVTTYGAGEMDERIKSEWNARKEQKREERRRELQMQIHREHEREQERHCQRRRGRYCEHDRCPFYHSSPNRTTIPEQVSAPESARGLRGSETHVEGKSYGRDGKFQRYYQNLRNEMEAETPPKTSCSRTELYRSIEGGVSGSDESHPGTQMRGNGDAVPIMMRGRPCRRQLLEVNDVEEWDEGKRPMPEKRVLDKGKGRVDRVMEMR